MEKYIGVKMIEAEPAIRIDKCKYYSENAVPPSLMMGSNEAEKGYMVVYEDGYNSWSPKKVFEKAYRQFGSDKNTVTQEDVDGFIAKKEVSTIGSKTTLVVVTLVNGFVITESSACVDEKNYDEKMGAEICMKKVKDKIWFLLGFLLQCGVNGLNSNS